MSGPDPATGTRKAIV